MGNPIPAGRNTGDELANRHFSFLILSAVSQSDRSRAPSRWRVRPASNIDWKYSNGRR